MSKYEAVNSTIPAYQSFRGSRYHSIKSDSYFVAYQHLLQRFVGTECVFVEVGVMSGGSLFMWRDFLGPQARIIGIELNENARKWEEHGFEIYIGDQSDPSFWADFYQNVGPIDVLLDDGGHTNEQQVVTLCESLPHVRDGGLVIIEDVGTSYMSRFGNPSPSSVVELSKSIVDAVNSRCFKEPGEGHVASRVWSLQFFESMIAFEVDRRRCLKGSTIANGGESDGASDVRVQQQSEEFRRSFAGLGGMLPEQVRRRLHTLRLRVANRWGRTARVVRSRIPR